MKFKSEEEFGEAFVKTLHLFGYETWQEVSVMGAYSIDVIAKKDDQYYVFELKLAMSDTLLEQTVRASKLLNNCLCYAVIPKDFGNRFYSSQYTLNSKVKRFYLEKHDVGLMIFKTNIWEKVDESVQIIDKYSWNYFTVATNDFSNADIIDIYMKSKISQGRLNIEDYLFDDQKECKAGSKSGGSITPFKRSCNLIIKYLTKNGAMTKKRLWEDLQDKLHWSSYNSMCGAFRDIMDVEEIITINKLLKG